MPLFATIWCGEQPALKLPAPQVASHRRASQHASPGGCDTAGVSATRRPTTALRRHIRYLLSLHREKDFTSYNQRRQPRQHKTSHLKFKSILRPRPNDSMGANALLLRRTSMSLLTDTEPECGAPKPEHRKASPKKSSPSLKSRYDKKFDIDQFGWKENKLTHKRTLELLSQVLAQPPSDMLCQILSSAKKNKKGLMQVLRIFKPAMFFKDGEPVLCEPKVKQINRKKAILLHLFSPEVSGENTAGPCKQCQSMFSEGFTEECILVPVKGKDPVCTNCLYHNRDKCSRFVPMMTPERLNSEAIRKVYKEYTVDDYTCLTMADLETAISLLQSYTKKRDRLVDKVDISTAFM